MKSLKNENSAGPAGTELVRAVLAADRLTVRSELAADAVFNSPIRRYENPADVELLLSLIGAVLPGARIERSWHGTGGAATIISATVDETHLDGLVEELHDHDGRVREVTVMLRPHAAMMLAIKRMSAALSVL